MSPVRHSVFVIVILFFGCTVGQTAEEPGVLIPATWLQEHMDDSSMILLHVGFRSGFDSVHIPGARFFDPYDFTVDRGDLRNEVPEMDTIVSLLASVGVNVDSRIVLYYEDEDLIPRTARVFATLDYAGLGDRTSVLNGGLSGWMEENNEATDRAPDVSTGNLETSGNLETASNLETSEHRNVFVRAGIVDQYRRNPEYMVIDVRSGDEYFGKYDTTAQRSTGGHIEGALFSPYQSLLSESRPYMFRGDDELRKAFEDMGMDGRKTAVYYCNSGVRASVSYMVAKHLGYSSLIYDGSFEEWEILGLPVIQGGRFEEKLSEAALSLTRQTVVYDPAYYSMVYPNGDVPDDRGVCSDVIIRAYRQLGIDLQKEVHEDMVANFDMYSDTWGLNRPDPNIDHRRVPNLMTFFERHGVVKEITVDPGDYLPGDIVCWNLGGGITHIGIVVDRRTPTAIRYQVVHNIGAGQVLEDCLFDFRIIGHYMYSGN